MMGRHRWFAVDRDGHRCSCGHPSRVEALRCTEVQHPAHAAREPDRVAPPRRYTPRTPPDLD